MWYAGKLSIQPTYDTILSMCIHDCFSDSPICKPNQRIIYGTARKSKTEISCQVDAKPLPINFQWQFKTANGKGGSGNLINNPNMGNGDVIDLIKDMVDLKDIKIEYCSTNEMVADFLTKALQGKKFF